MAPAEEDFSLAPQDSFRRGWLGRLLTAAAFAAGAAFVAWVLRAAVVAWGVPPWLEGLLGTRPTYAAVLYWVLWVGWCGLVPAWLSACLLRSPLLALGLPLWAVIGGGVGLLLCRLAAQAGGAGIAGESLWQAGPGTARPAIVGELALHGGVFLLLTAGAGFAVAAGRLRWPRSLYAAALLALLAAPWFVLARTLAVDDPGLRRLFDALRSNPVPGDLPAAALLVVGSALAAAIARAWTSPSAWGVALAAGGLALLAVPGCLLANLALRPEYTAGSPASDLLLWLLVQSLLVLVLSLGAAAALGLTLSPPASGEAPRRAEARALRRSRPGRALSALATVYAVLLVYGSLVPLEVIPLSFPQAVERFLNTPYLSLSVEKREDLVANLLFYVPLTFLALGAATDGGRRPGRVAAAVVVVAAGCALAVVVEFVQEFFAPRTVSRNDILMECLGSAVGAAVWFAFGPRVARWGHGLWTDRDSLATARRLLAAYAVFLCLYEVLPVDLVVSEEEFLHKLARGTVTLVPFADLSWHRPLMVFRLAAAVPLGFLVGLWARRRPSRAAAGLAVGALVSLALQLLRLPVYSRTSSLTDVVLWGLGAALGAALTHLLGPAADRPVPRTPWTVAPARVLMGFLAAALAGALVWRKWQSFDFLLPRGGLLRAALDSLRVPFYQQYFNSEFEAISQMLSAFGTMAVLAALLRGLLGGRRFGLVCAVAATSVFSLVLEVGKLLVAHRVPDRVPDATTAVIALAGGVAGALAYPWLVRCFVLPPADAAAIPTETVQPSAPATRQ